MPICTACEIDKPATEFRVRPERNMWRLKRCKSCEAGVQIRNYYRAKTRDEVAWRVGVLRNCRSRLITLEWLAQTLAAQHGKCALSGRPITILDCEVDHIVPRTRGGTDELANLRLVCRRANLVKGNMTDGELLQICREIIGQAILTAEQQQAEAA